MIIDADADVCAAEYHRRPATHDYARRKARRSSLESRVAADISRYKWRCCFEFNATGQDECVVAAFISPAAVALPPLRCALTATHFRHDYLRLRRDARR